MRRIVCQRREGHDRNQEKNFSGKEGHNLKADEISADETFS
jgi:hypothetical protein